MRRSRVLLQSSTPIICVYQQWVWGLDGWHGGRLIGGVWGVGPPQGKQTTVKTYLRLFSLQYAGRMIAPHLASLRLGLVKWSKATITSALMNLFVLRCLVVWKSGMSTEQLFVSKRSQTQNKQNGHLCKGNRVVNQGSQIGLFFSVILQYFILLYSTFCLIHIIL